MTRKAGEAILRGAHVFAPGVLAFSQGVLVGDRVAVSIAMELPGAGTAVHAQRLLAELHQVAEGLIGTHRLECGGGRCAHVTLWPIVWKLCNLVRTLAVQGPHSCQESTWHSCSGAAHAISCTSQHALRRMSHHRTVSALCRVQCSDTHSAQSVV